MVKPKHVGAFYVDFKVNFNIFLEYLIVHPLDKVKT